MARSWKALSARPPRPGRPVRATLSVASENRANLTALNGVAIIPGKSPEMVIVNGHADSWFDGANDNADGLSVLVGLAEYYAKRPKPDRTLLFMVSGGHHTGNGPAAFIAAHPEIMKETVLVMNLEHLAQIAVAQGPRLDPATNGYGSGVWVASTAETVKQVGAANTTPFVTELLGRAAKQYGLVTVYQPTQSVPGDLGAYVRTGIAVGAADFVGGLLPLLGRHSGDHLHARPGARGAVFPRLHRRGLQDAEGQDRAARGDSSGQSVEGSGGAGGPGPGEGRRGDRLPVVGVLLAAGGRPLHRPASAGGGDIEEAGVVAARRGRRRNIGGGRPDGDDLARLQTFEGVVHGP